MTPRFSRRTADPGPWGHGWVPALLFIVVLVASLIATVIGVMTESGWLWGHPGRGVALYIGVAVIELGLVWWWARAGGHSPLPLLVGGALVAVLLGLGRNWLLVACFAVAVVAWIRRKVQESRRGDSP